MNFGIDINHWNGSVKELRDIDFVIAKATEGSSGPNSMDDEFALTLAAARAAGIRFGAFHMLRETSPVSAQTAHFIRYVGLKSGEFMAVDLETEWAKAMRKRWGAGTAFGLIQMGQDLAAEERVKPLLYASQRSLEAAFALDFDEHRARWPMQELGMLAEVYDLWIVQYVDELYANQNYRNVEERSPIRKGWWPGKVVLRQYTSSGDGRPFGVPDKTVDFNLCYDMQRLVANCKPGLIAPVSDGPWWSEAQIRRRYRPNLTPEQFINYLKNNEPPLPRIMEVRNGWAEEEIRSAARAVVSKPRPHDSSLTWNEVFDNFADDVVARLKEGK